MRTFTTKSMSTKELKRQKNVSKGLVKNREYLKMMSCNQTKKVPRLYLSQKKHWVRKDLRPLLKTTIQDPVIRRVMSVMLVMSVTIRRRQEEEDSLGAFPAFFLQISRQSQNFRHTGRKLRRRNSLDRIRQDKKLEI